MPLSEQRSRWLFRLAVIVGGWTILAGIRSANIALYRVSIGLPAQTLTQLRESLFDYWIWAALTPAIFALVTHYPFRRASWPRVVLLHLLAFPLVALLHEGAAQLIHLPQALPPGFAGSQLLFRWVTESYDDLWMYGPLVVICSLFDTYRRYRERDAQAVELRERLGRAELQALRNQLNPHLLFNALNSVAALMHEDVAAADDMLADLSHLLRTYLSRDNPPESTLAAELELIRAYVGIQQRRFEELACTIEVPEELLSARVPSLLIQPLVENAILHGISPSGRVGELRVVARREGASIRLEISDNGVGLAAGYREQIGLSNTRARLRALYEERHTFALGNRPAGGVEVAVTLPLSLSDPGT